MVVIIKPTEDATYGNVVSILDDMNIYDVKKYALVPTSHNDIDIVNAKRTTMGLPPLSYSDQTPQSTR